jgi:hypothetical protein
MTSVVSATNRLVRLGGLVNTPLVPETVSTLTARQVTNA